MVTVAGTMTLMSARGAILAAVVAGEGDGGEGEGAGALEGAEAVGGVAGGGDGEQDVAGLAEGFDLAGEDVVEAVVVADGGEDGAVGGEGDGAEGGAVDGEADDELGDDVLGVRGEPPLPQTRSLWPLCMASAVTRADSSRDW